MHPRLPKVCVSLVHQVPCVILCFVEVVAHSVFDGARPTQGSPEQYTVICDRVAGEAGGLRPQTALTWAPLAISTTFAFLLLWLLWGSLSAAQHLFRSAFALASVWVCVANLSRCRNKFCRPPGALSGYTPRHPGVAGGFSMEGAPPRLSSREKPLHRSEWPSILPTSMLFFLVYTLPVGARAHPLLQLEPQALKPPCPCQGMVLEMRSSFEKCLHPGVGAFRWGEARHPGPPNVFFQSPL